MQLMQQFQDPQAVMQILVQAGMPQEQAMQVMQQVMQGAQQQQQQGPGEEVAEGAASNPQEEMQEAPMMAFGGPTDPPVEAVSSNNAVSSYRGKALFPGQYGDVDWATRNNGNPIAHTQNRGWMDSIKMAMQTNQRIRQDYVDPNGVPYNQYAKVSPRAFHVDNAQENYTFAFGGPTNFAQILKEGGEALKKEFTPKIEDYSTKDTESYVKDWQTAFASIVSRNNIHANLNRGMNDMKDLFNPLPKAANGLEVMTRDEYTQSRNAEGFDKTTAGEEWDKFNAGKGKGKQDYTTPLSYWNGQTGWSSKNITQDQFDLLSEEEKKKFQNTGTVGTQNQGMPYTIPWSPYGQQNPNAQLRPFGQILGAFQPNYGGNPRVRGRGDMRGLEAQFLQQGMSGVGSDGRHWSVSDIENKNGLFRNKTKFNIQWDGTGAPSQEGMESGQAPGMDPNGNSFNERLMNGISRFAPRIASRMVPSFAPSGDNGNGELPGRGDEAYKNQFGHYPGEGPANTTFIPPTNSQMENEPMIPFPQTGNPPQGNPPQGWAPGVAPEFGMTASNIGASNNPIMDNAAAQTQVVPDASQPGPDGGYWHNPGAKEGYEGDKQWFKSEADYKIVDAKRKEVYPMVEAWAKQWGIPANEANMAFAKEVGVNPMFSNAEDVKRFDEIYNKYKQGFKKLDPVTQSVKPVGSQVKSPVAGGGSLWGVQKAFGGPMPIFAPGGSFTVKNNKYNLDLNMLADGLYGSGMNGVDFANQVNTGVNYEDRFNNYNINNVQGTGEPMGEGIYDQWGRWIPNDQSAKVLAGTGDKSAEFASRDNNFFGGTGVMAFGGDYNTGDEFDMSDEEEERISAQLKAAGYTFKKIR
jgi:hypothetical protein